MFKKFKGKSKETKEFVFGYGCYTDRNRNEFIIIENEKSGKKDFVQVEEINDWFGEL